MSAKALAPTWMPPQDRIRFYREARFWRDASVTDNLRRCVDRFGSKTAIRDSNESLTFAQIWEAATSVAGWLRANGLQRGEAVAFQLPNWVESAVVFHGILMAGGVVVPLTPILRHREVGFILGQTAARFVFTTDEFRKFDFHRMYVDLSEEGLPIEHVVHVRASREGLTLEDVLEYKSVSAEAIQAAAGRGNDVALVIYTSGTTADPKGAIHTHDTVLASTRMCESWFALNETDVLFNPSPVSHITGISLSFLFPATFGCSATLQEAWDPEEAFNTIIRDRTTFLMFATPFLAALTEITERRDLRVKTIRTIVCGGADVPTELSRRAFARLGEVVRMYGATESPNVSCGSPWDPPDKKWGTEGRWLFPVETRIVEPSTRADLATGEVGEVWWRAPQMCLGYVDESLNTGSYTPDGYFRTGDLARVDPEGFVTVSGRIKEIINRGGEKISSREIEDLIYNCPAVAEAAVTPMSDPVLGEKVCAWVVLREGHHLSLEQLCDHLMKYGLAKQKLPQRLELVPELPRTPSGKIRKQVLRERIDATLS